MVTYQSPVNNARVTVLEDEVDDTIHYITLHYITYTNRHVTTKTSKQTRQTNM